MGLMRNRGFLAAVAMTVLVGGYILLVAQMAYQFIVSGSLVGAAIGWALFLLPAIAVWFVVVELRLATTVQHMADALGRTGDLPLRTSSGRLPEERREAVVAEASRKVEAQPESWKAWFHLGFAYDAAGDRRTARRTLRHAADLFRAERKAARAA